MPVEFCWAIIIMICLCLSNRANIYETYLALPGTSWRYESIQQPISSSNPQPTSNQHPPITTVTNNLPTTTNNNQQNNPQLTSHHLPMLDQNYSSQTDPTLKVHHVTPIFPGPPSTSTERIEAGSTRHSWAVALVHSLGDGVAPQGHPGLHVVASISGGWRAGKNPAGPS